MAQPPCCQLPYLPARCIERSITGKGLAMARVFLSYDHEDAAKARPVAVALERTGHSVWWDEHIKAGAQYNKEIDRALKEADAVVVLWSERSVDSAWVRDEAAAGRDRGRLIPVSLDDVEPPLGFRQYQTIDLSSARGRGRSGALKQLVGAVEVFGASTTRTPEAAAGARPQPGRKLPLMAIALVLLALAGTAAGILLWRPWATAAVPIVAIRPADSSTDSQTFARDLFVRLGAAQSERTQSVQLVDESARETPDLILEVSGTTSTARPLANLVLLRAKDRQLLSSQDLAAPEGEAADLKTSIAVAATSALDCATAALASRPPLRLDLLKQYLGACTRFGSLYGMEDVSILIPQLEQVVQREPQFHPARKQLLLAGAYMRSIPTEVAKPSPQWLRMQIEAARRIEPAMPELRLAELELLRTTDFAGRIARVDSLRQEFPDDMFVLGARAEQLMLVGRNNEAVVDAERAARLDPLAPYSRSEYVRGLAFSGRLSRALEELKGYQPLSPVAMNLTDTRFRVNMRYGDPQLALRLLRMYGTSKAHDAFLVARIEPTQENIERAMAIARAIAAERGFYSPLAEVLEAFGRDNEVFQALMNVPPGRVDQFTLQTLFRPTLRNLRQNPRFLRLAQHFGLLNYWKASGKWPDFCLEPDLPYDCKKEAAKLAA
jgi:hypothetical protein